MRLGASTFQSSSNDSNEIRCSCLVPENAASTRCLKDSVESTVMVTAPISSSFPCVDIGQEIVEQSVHGNEPVARL